MSSRIMNKLFCLVFVVIRNVQEYAPHLGIVEMSKLTFLFYGTGVNWCARS